MDAIPLVPSVDVSVTLTALSYQPFVPGAPERLDVLAGGVTSTIVHVSLPAGAVSRFPAKSRAIDRKAYRWPSWPAKDPLVAAVPTNPGSEGQGPPLSLASVVHVAPPAGPGAGPHERGTGGVRVYAGREPTRESGRLTSTTVQVSLPEGSDSTLPALSVALDRNSYRWPSAPGKSAEVDAVDGTQSVHAPPLSRTWMRYVAMSNVSN